MKFYDSQYLFGNILDVLVKYVFPGDNNLDGIFKVFVWVHVLLSMAILLVPKTKET